MFETTSNISSKRTFTSQEIEILNDVYKPLTARQRIEKLYHDFQITDVMLTRQFAATSAFLLKLVSDVNLKQEVFFIDTGYHFEETLNYKKTLEEKYNLNITSISAIKDEHVFTTKDQTWSKNPDFCCSINKVRPLDRIKAQYNIWMSGLMEWQSDHRSSLNIFEQRGNILKFYPLLDISKELRDAYIQEHQLPFHPLVAKGYHSIGCKHCTVPGEDRGGRWNNNPKTECGLHL